MHLKKVLPKVMNDLMLLLVTFLLSFSAFAQFDVAIPLKGNPDRGEVDANSNSSTSCFLPDGLSSKIGHSLHYKKYTALGIQS